MTHLSPRERKVVEMVGGDGMSFALAAKRLGISVHTVRTYVYRIASRVKGERPPREKLVAIFERELSH